MEILGVVIIPKREVVVVGRWGLRIGSTGIRRGKRLTLGIWAPDTEMKLDGMGNSWRGVEVMGMLRSVAGMYAGAQGRGGR
jgi:hypothetical protein